ncbi:MAG: YihY family inner membrane protein [Rhodospirillales bacterium]|nr:MAG: YihY family inner membrane protein [Rhodospirillales bacterium]
MQAIDRLTRLIWNTDLSTRPGWQRAALGLARLLWVVFRDIQEGELTLRAMSLVYTSLLSLVPLLAISFSVLKGFGVHGQMEPLILGALEPLGEEAAADVTERLIDFVDRMQVGVLGAVGLAFLFYTVVALMQKIEGSFNYIWHIRGERPLTRRFSDYLSVLLIGPVLVFLAIAVATMVTATPAYQAVVETPGIGAVVAWATSLAPYVLVILAFTFLYIFMPNTRVRFGSALVGGLVAGGLWAAAGTAFASFVATSTQYAAVYSAFAAMVLFLIWLFVTWLVVLVGGSIAFYHQNPDFVTKDRPSLLLSNSIKERLALSVAHLVGQSYYLGNAPWTLERLAVRLHVPRDALSTVVDALAKAGLITQVAEAWPPAYLPAKPPDMTPLKAVLDAVRSTDQNAGADYGWMPRDPAIEGLQEAIDRAIERALDKQTVKDLALSPLATATAEDDGTVDEAPGRDAAG